MRNARRNKTSRHSELLRTVEYSNELNIPQQKKLKRPQRTNPNKQQMGEK